ncbi:hypothetical protein CLV32_0280 [Pedobacter duraquae]|uniref:Uncharacterized protein n=1 Tax=Pedobacter duraquae TaxID=425511 RepID=A0A4R6IP19_9SPHI|nr:hypothetical protein CLV32_0280 [Pedobacter duraquae]
MIQKTKLVNQINTIYFDLVSFQSYTDMYIYKNTVF